MEKVLVTGAAGFIGSHLCELLVSKNIHVIGVDNLSTGKISNLSGLLPSKYFTFIESDIKEVRNKTQEHAHQIDCIYHLAALADIVPSIEKPDSYFESNVNGTFKMVEFAREFGVRNFVYAASSSCYGIAEQIPTTEQACIDPKYPYALTKYLGEQIVIHWARVFGFKGTSLRLFNVYGPRARTSGNYGAVFGVFLAQKLANKPLTIVGDGNQTRDFTHVTDVVEAFYKASINSNVYRTRIMNVGSGRTVPVNELARLIGGSLVYVPKRPGEPDVTFADTSLITQELGWKPTKRLEDGVQELLDSINEFADAPVWDEKSIGEATRLWFERLGNA